MFPYTSIGFLDVFLTSFKIQENELIYSLFIICISLNFKVIYILQYIEFVLIYTIIWLAKQH